LAEAATWVMVIVAAVLLVNLMLLPALVVFTTWLLKATAVGANTIVCARPVPFAFASCGLFVALSVTTSVPWRLPVAVGVKNTEIVQFAPAATELPQVLVCV
jgi:hypothetical protein